MFEVNPKSDKQDASSKMRILFLSVNFDGWIASTVFYEQKAILKQLPNSIIYGPGFQYDTNSVPDIIKKYFGNDTPDAIFCYVNERRLIGEPLSDAICQRYGIEGDLSIFPKGLDEISHIPKIAWVNDFWHCSRQEWDTILLGNGFDYAFSTYCPPFVSQAVFDSFFSQEVQKRVRFIPWPRAISPEIFQDYGFQKVHDVTLLGAMNKSFYPLRYKMHDVFSQYPGIQYFHQSHPGYRYVSEKQALTGKRYAQCIQQSKIFASCTGKYHIPFIKLNEVLACGTALLCDEPEGASLLGLKAYESYLPVTEENFLDTALYYLSDESALKSISMNAKRLFHDRHTVDIRAREFVEIVDGLLHGQCDRHWAQFSPKVKKISSVFVSRSSNKEFGMEIEYNSSCHITDVVHEVEPSLYSIWYKYGANYQVNSNPPIVTEYPELVMLRGKYLCQLAKQSSASTFAEVGTARGFQSFMWARYLIENRDNNGIVYTCDVKGIDERVFRTPVDGNRVFTRRELWAGTPEAKKVCFVDGDSAAMSRVIDRPIDFLYIDGKHTENAVLCDFEQLKKFLHPGSIIVFDDCDERFQGIQNAVSNICSMLGVKCRSIHFAPSLYKIAWIQLDAACIERISHSNTIGDVTRDGFENSVKKKWDSSVSSNETESLQLITQNHKSRILFVVDRPGWAHDFKTDNLIRNLGEFYQMEKAYCDRVTSEQIQRADLVVIYYWKQVQNENMRKLVSVLQQQRHKILMGICSHHEFEGQWRKIGLTVLNELASGVFMNSKLLYSEFASELKVPVFYTPNGVDTQFYTPANRSKHVGKLIIGWAGSIKNHGDKRGYHEYIVPAVEELKQTVELRTAIREDRWRTKEQMREFYQQLDLYICASRTEGTPNPCLEAMACGVPVLTTPVGNMPELIRQGVNGYFIERDVQSVIGRLKYLVDRPQLIRSLSQNARQIILGWDWKYHAQHYRKMFDAMLDRHTNQESLFKSQGQVYIASADRMDKVLQNVDSLKQKVPEKVDHYLSVIGGLSGLNYLLSVDPKVITFFDVNLHALEYAKLILELISISSDHTDFISRVFARSVATFLSQNQQVDLSVENQHLYLSMPVDQEMLKETFNRLSKQGGQLYRTFLLPYLSGEVLEGVRNCRCLLPCFGIHERVPVGGGKDKGYDGQGRLVPNLNTFFYGHGWLESKETFICVQNRLKNAKVALLPLNLLETEVEKLADFSNKIVLHASNIDDWFKEAWSEWIAQIFKHSLSCQGSLHVITTNGGITASSAHPHDKALAAIAPYVSGKVVEVTHKVPWGFHEFSRENVLYSDYLRDSYPADTTILHILVGEGLSVNQLREIYQRALIQSRRVLVMEHNRDSADWSSEKVKRFLTISETHSLLESVPAAEQAEIKHVQKIAGENDLARNVLFVVECENVVSKRTGADNDSDSIPTCSHLQKVCPDASKNKALAYFQQAQKQFGLGNMVSARRLISQYDSARNYDQLPVRRAKGRKGNPLFSVLLITYNRPKDVGQCIESLKSQRCQNFEIVMVDNGQPDKKAAELAGQVDVYIDCPINFNLSEGRNIGAHFASGEILVFLDDDALVGPEYLESIKHAFEQYDILALRGRAFPKNQEQSTSNIGVYDLGEKPLATLCNQEGNSAFRRDAYLAVGGMDPLLFGHEGSDISYRLMQQYQRPSAIMYSPQTVIYHDYGTGDKFNQKQKRYERNRDYLKYKYNIDVIGLKDEITKRPLKQNASGQLLPPLPLLDKPAEKSIPDTVQSGRNPKVSVIMSCHNAAAFLSETLGSILNQSLTDWELLIADDGSTDQTKSLLLDYANMDARIRVWFFDDQKGPYVRRNFMIEKAKAPFISIQDADDLMAPDKLKILYEEITSDEQLAIVGSHFRRFLGVFRGEDFGDRIQKQITHKELMEAFPRTWHLCWHGSAIIRKSLFDVIGLYDEQPYGSDTFWLSKAGLYGLLTGQVKFKNLPEFLTYKREHAQSQTGKISPVDPRSRRHRLERYYLQKLHQIMTEAQRDPSVNVAEKIKECSCTDFIPKFSSQFEQWESAPLNKTMILTVMNRGMAQFSFGQYVSALITLNYLDQMVSNAGQMFKNFNLTRGMAWYACGDDRQAIEYLEKEVQLNENQYAKRFLTTYLRSNNRKVGANQRQVYVREFIDASSQTIPAQSNSLAHNPGASDMTNDLQQRLTTARQYLNQGQLHQASSIYHDLLSDNMVANHIALKEKLQELVKLIDTNTVSRTAVSTHASGSRAVQPG